MKSSKLTSDKFGIGRRNRLTKLFPIRPTYSHCFALLCNRWIGVKTAFNSLFHDPRWRSMSAHGNHVGCVITWRHQDCPWLPKLKSPMSHYFQSEVATTEHYISPNRSVCHVLHNPWNATIYEFLAGCFDEILIFSSIHSMRETSGRKLLARRRSPNKVKPFKRVLQCVSEKEREWIVFLWRYVHSDNLRIWPCTMQSHSSAASAAVEVTHAARLHVSPAWLSSACAVLAVLLWELYT